MHTKQRLTRLQNKLNNNQDKTQPLIIHWVDCETDNEGRGYTAARPYYDELNKHWLSKTEYKALPRKARENITFVIGWDDNW